MEILFAAQGLGPISKGAGGGVESTIKALSHSLNDRGHKVTVVAPYGSTLPGVNLIEVEGEHSVNLLDTNYSAEIVDINPVGVLPAIWQKIAQIEKDFDLVANFAYDWLTFYLTDFISIPVVHILSLSSCIEIIDRQIETVLNNHPASVGVHSLSQAGSYRFGNRLKVIGNGIGLDLFKFNPEGGSSFACVGRISPEKQFEHAFEAAAQLNARVNLYGKLQNEAYFDSLCKNYKNFDYRGFLSPEELQKQLGLSRALLVTSQTEETYCLAAAEAQACGVPVIAYDRGSLNEVTKRDATALMVKPDCIDELTVAMTKVGNLNRKACRLFAEEKLSIENFSLNVETWFKDILNSDQRDLKDGFN